MQDLCVAYCSEVVVVFGSKFRSSDIKIEDVRTEYVRPTADRRCDG